MITMQQYGVLVVDDSALMRRAISQLLEKDPQFFVIGIARNGAEAVEKVQRLRPDLVTMDVEMPVMNGLEALEKIMKTTPVPVVMLSSLTKAGATATIKALELGAVEFFLKDRLLKEHPEKEHIDDFFNRLKGIVQAKPKHHQVPETAQQEKVIKKKKQQGKTDLIIIGCSTGGPSALQTILPRFPADFSIPVVVAQHMPQGFTKPLAERFDTICPLKVKEIENGELLRAGTIYIAPSGYQTTFERKSDGKIICKVENQTEIKSLYKPCVDITLSSAAPIFKAGLFAVILTGMGADGMKGCGEVKKYNGTVFVEAEESCIVYGMPKAVYEAGHADGQFALSRIYQEIISFL